MEKSSIWIKTKKCSKQEGLLHALLILTYTSKNQVVHEQKLKDPLSSTCQINPERRVLDLESKVNKRPAFKSH